MILGEHWENSPLAEAELTDQPLDETLARGLLAAIRTQRLPGLSHAQNTDPEPVGICIETASGAEAVCSLGQLEWASQSSTLRFRQSPGVWILAPTQRWHLLCACLTRLEFRRQLKEQEKHARMPVHS